MACGGKSHSENLSEDLTCAICYDLFRDPVMLGCMHHFCRPCITTYWRGIRGPAVCPQCRQEFPKKQFQPNYLVAGLVEKVRGNSSAKSLNNWKKQLMERLESQSRWKETILSTMRKDNEDVAMIRKVGAELQERVHSDFQALHHFLQVEEEAMLDQLRREQTELERSLECHLDALHATVQELERSIVSLQTHSRAANPNPQLELPEVSISPQVQAFKRPDVDDFRSKYVAPLQYTVWRKMFQNVNPAPLRLTFDKDTVHPSLVLSRDMTQVVETDTMLPYKPNPKRFVQCVNVLASQGFDTGRRYWEVGVGIKPKWDLGVALETVDRKARVKLCPDNGYWTLRLRNSTEYSAGTQPWTRVPVTAAPLRIGVFLDCDERRVSFYDADNMRLLYSFSNLPRGKIFPFFSTCISEPGRKNQPIQLLHFSTMAP